VLEEHTWLDGKSAVWDYGATGFERLIRTGIPHGAPKSATTVVLAKDSMSCFVSGQSLLKLRGIVFQALVYLVEESPATLKRGTEILS